MKTIDELRDVVRKEANKNVLLCITSSIGQNMGIMEMDRIFDKYAFHRGDQNKPFAMLRNTFREAAREVELITQENELKKSYAIQLEIYQELEKEYNWVLDAIDDETIAKREMVFLEMIQNKMKGLENDIKI